MAAGRIFALGGGGGGTLSSNWTPPLAGPGLCTRRFELKVEKLWLWLRYFWIYVLLLALDLQGAMKHPLQRDFRHLSGICLGAEASSLIATKSFLPKFGMTDVFWRLLMHPSFL